MPYNNLKPASPVISRPVAAPEEEMEYSPIRVAIALILLIAIIGGLGYGIYRIWPKGIDCEYDKSCFIENANQCKQAVVLEEITGGTAVRYESKNCIVTKKIDRFGSAEPEEIIAFFKGKSMECAYTQGNFNTAVAQALSTGLDSCDGELKDAIVELRLAQLGAV